MPVKGRSYKSRLSKRIGPAQRLKLSALFLTDLLETIAKVGLVSDTFVVSSNRQMLQLARSQGAKSIEEEGESGVNAAVIAALWSLHWYQDFLVLPSDLPLLRPSDIRRAIALKRTGMNVVISPSASFDGTNLLMVSRSFPLELSYDDNSFWNHVGNAAKKRYSLAVYASRGVLIDVDTDRDVKEVLRTRINRGSIAFLRERSNKE